MAFPFLETSPSPEFLSLLLFSFSIFCNNSCIGSFPVAVQKHQDQGNLQRKGLFDCMVPEGSSPLWWGSSSTGS